MAESMSLNGAAVSVADAWSKLESLGRKPGDIRASYGDFSDLDAFAVAVVQFLNRSQPDSPSKSLDDRRLVESIFDVWLKNTAETLRGVSKTSLMPVARPTLTCLQQVESPFRVDFVKNVAVPLIRKFPRSASNYGEAIGYIQDVAGRKYSAQAKKQIYGNGNHTGIHKTLSAMPAVKEPLVMLKQICQIIEELSSVKRQVFLAHVGHELMTELGKVKECYRHEVMQVLLDKDREATMREWLPKWGFVTYSGRETIREINLHEAAGKPEMTKIANGRLERWAPPFPVSLAPAKPILVTCHDELEPVDMRALRETIANQGGKIDIIVHPRASEEWIVGETGEFTDPFTQNAGRTRADYEEYKRQLVESIKGDAQTPKVQIFLCDSRHINETREWLLTLQSVNHIIIVPTRPSSVDALATPLVDEIAAYADTASRLANIQKGPQDATDPIYVPWEHARDFLTALGVQKATIYGEYAMATVIDGRPGVDSEGNMLLNRGCCVEGARRRLLKFIPVDLDDTTCFPHSTTMAPIKSLSVRNLADFPDDFLPESIRDATQKLFPDNHWAIIGVHVLHEAALQSGGSSALEFDEFCTLLNSIVARNNPAAGLIVGRAVLFARDIAEPDKRLKKLNKTLQAFDEVCRTTNLFGHHVETLRAIDEQGTLDYLSSVIEIGLARVGRINRSQLALVKENSPVLMARLLSQPRTSEGEFEVEIAFWDQLIDSMLPHSSSKSRKETISSLVSYVEELTLLSNLGFLKGTVLYMEAGPDVLPFIALRKKQEVGGSESRFIWTSAHEFELRAALATIAETTIGFETFTRQRSVQFPVSRNIDGDYSQASKTTGGTTHIQARMSHGYQSGDPIPQFLNHTFPSEARGIENASFVALPGHSTDSTSLAEYLGSSSPDTVIVKGMEVWAFSLDKGAGSVENSNLPALYKALDRLISFCRPGTTFLVSGQDPNAAKFFDQHPDFYEAKRRFELNELQKGYPERPVAVQIPFSDDTKRFGSVDLTKPMRDLDSLSMVLEGNFRVFVRKGDLPSESNKVEQIHERLFGIRETGEYMRYFGEALLTFEAFRPVFTDGDKLFHVRDELIATFLLLQECEKVKSALVFPTDNKDELVERGLSRHPMLWTRFRNIRERHFAEPESVDLHEITLLHELIAYQVYLEESLYGDLLSIPPGAKGWTADHEYRPPERSAPVHQRVEVNPVTPHASLRASLYARLGLPQDESDDW